jgi:RHS repeat-associated protein
LKVEKQVDNGSGLVEDEPKQTLAEMSYNELGQLIDKNLHGGIDGVKYAYNIRGWLKSMNSNKFSMNLYYNDAEGNIGSLGGNDLYNGNISAISWKNNTGEDQAYAFDYDGISRIKSADYGSGDSFSARGAYSVSGISYDANGNIMSLKRASKNLLSAEIYEIDDLSYTYSGNQLKAVEDASSLKTEGFINGVSLSEEYEYDENGNMIKDLNKKITEIRYNSLNLPKEIDISDVTKVRYVYSASGEKLMNIVGDKKTSYCGSFVYVDGSLKYILTDHLGNVRAVIDESGALIQTNNYYPFGGVFAKSGSADNKYLYNGKELQEETDWLDYGARMYDPSLGRWHCADPLSDAEHNYTFSPYNYCINNPIAFIDPNGMDWFYYKEDGEEDPSYHWHDGSRYNSGVKDDNGNDIYLDGAQTVVHFEGSENERLGSKNDKGGYINGEGAYVARVTVYGSKGKDDINTYKGYTMSSDPDLFGKVADGVYDGYFHKEGKTGDLESNFALYGKVAALGNNNPAEPKQIDKYGNAYLIGVFIHSTNRSGAAGTYIDKLGKTQGISEGCLLIAASDWARFKKNLTGVTYFNVRITRD